MQATVENNPAPAEIPASPVQTENQTPPAAPVQAAPTPPAPVTTPPPASRLVTQGEVTDERELALQRREREISERESRRRKIHSVGSAARLV